MAERKRTEELFPGLPDAETIERKAPAALIASKPAEPKPIPRSEDLRRTATHVKESLASGAGELWHHVRSTRKRGIPWRAIIGLCLLCLFFLGLWFAVWSRVREPTDTIAMSNQSVNISVQSDRLPKIAWRGQEYACTETFAERTLEGVERLGRRDGNQCAKIIAAGLHPRACLRNLNLQFISGELAKYREQKFNSTCDSQASFDAAVARTYYEAFARYTKYPDLSYETPYPDVEDFIVTTPLPNIPLTDVTVLSTLSCDPEWFRENKKELAHRENVAILTGVVSDELKKLRIDVTEMQKACATEGSQ